MQFEASASATTRRASAPAAHATLSRRLFDLLQPPPFADPEKTRVASVINTWLLCNFTICTALFGYVWLTQYGHRSLLYVFGLGSIGNVALYTVLRLGHVRLAGMATVIGTISFVVLSNLLAVRPFAIGTAAGFLTLIIAGAMLGRREVMWTAATLIVSILASGAYWTMQTTVPINRQLLLLDMAVYSCYSVAVGAIVYITTGQLRRALHQLRESRLELAERHQRLERAIASRQGSEDRQQRLTSGLQGILHATSALLQCETVDDLWRRAVELARAELGLERCSVYMRESEDSSWLRGTCGTDLDGGSVDERSVRFDMREQNAHFVEDRSRPTAVEWRINPQQPLVTWNGAVLADSGIQGWVARTPIVGADGKLIGIFFNDSGRKRTPPDPDKQDLLAVYCSIIGRIAERKLLEMQVQQLSEERVRGAALAERSRLARELHDSVSQALFGIVLGVRTIRQAGADNPAAADEALDYVFKLSEMALSEMRTLVQALRPETLETEGLLAALRQQIAALCARSEITVNVSLGALEPPLSMQAKEAMYRVALQALQNALRHAQARTIDVTLEVERSAVLLTVRDDGRGFNPAEHFKGHYGLHTMRERTTQLGGCFAIDSAPGRGASVSMRLPHSA